MAQAHDGKPERAIFHRVTHRTQSILPLRSSGRPQPNLNAPVSRKKSISLKHQNNKSQTHSPKHAASSFRSKTEQHMIHIDKRRGYYNDEIIDNNSSHDHGGQKHFDRRNMDERLHRYQYDDDHSSNSTSQSEASSNTKADFDNEKHLKRRHSKRKGSYICDYSEVEKDNAAYSEDEVISDDDSSGSFALNKSGNECVGGLCILLTFCALVTSIIFAWQRRMDWLPWLFSPSIVPSSSPSSVPTIVPSSFPSMLPSMQPSMLPSIQPSMLPSESPSLRPTSLPSLFPTTSSQPSKSPTTAPSLWPTTADRKFISIDTWNQVGDDIGASFQPNVDVESFSLSHDGKCIAIGYNGYPDVGFVKVFKISEGSAQWDQVGQDLYGEGSIKLQKSFGNTLALTNTCNVIVIGNPAKYTGGSLEGGRVEVYRYFNELWAKSNSSTLNDDNVDGSDGWGNDGWAVDISDISENNEAIIATAGVPTMKTSFIGRTDIYKYSYEKDTLIKGHTIYGEFNNPPWPVGEPFSLSSDGDTIAVGCERTVVNDTVMVGNVYVYDRDGISWRLLGQNLVGAFRKNHFGKHVSLSGDASTLAVGTTSIDGIDEVQTFLLKNETWLKFGEHILGFKPSLSSDGNVLTVNSEISNRIYVQGEEEWLQIGPGLPNANSSIGEVKISANGNRIATSFTSDNTSMVRIYQGLNSEG